MSEFFAQENFLRVVKDTIGSIAESEKEVESARNGMECIIRFKYFI